LPLEKRKVEEGRTEKEPLLRTGKGGGEDLRGKKRKGGRARVGEERALTLCTFAKERERGEKKFPVKRRGKRKAQDRPNAGKKEKTAPFDIAGKRGKRQILDETGKLEDTSPAKGSGHEDRSRGKKSNCYPGRKRGSVFFGRGEKRRRDNLSRLEKGKKMGMARVQEGGGEIPISRGRSGGGKEGGDDSSFPRRTLKKGEMATMNAAKKTNSKGKKEDIDFIQCGGGRALQNLEKKEKKGGARLHEPTARKKEFGLRTKKKKIGMQAPAPKGGKREGVIGLKKKKKKCASAQGKKKIQRPLHRLMEKGKWRNQKKRRPLAWKRRRPGNGGQGDGNAQRHPGEKEGKGSFLKKNRSGRKKKKEGGRMLLTWKEGGGQVVKGGKEPSPQKEGGEPFFLSRPGAEITEGKKKKEVQENTTSRRGRKGLDLVIINH